MPTKFDFYAALVSNYLRFASLFQERSWQNIHHLWEWSKTRYKSGWIMHLTVSNINTVSWIEKKWFIRFYNSFLRYWKKKLPSWVIVNFFQSKILIQSQMCTCKDNLNNKRSFSPRKPFFHEGFAKNIKHGLEASATLWAFQALITTCLGCYFETDYVSIRCSEVMVALKFAAPASSTWSKMEIKQTVSCSNTWCEEIHFARTESLPKRFFGIF